MNVAYIDNQNLYMATHNAPEPWRIDMGRFRVYLREKYGVGHANLFMGAYEPRYLNRYSAFKDMGYTVLFREHAHTQLGKKKGNVDADVVFHIMRDLYEDQEADKLFLVSGDGDYFKTTEHLRAKGRLGKVLLPSHRNASSLYKKLTREYYSYLDTDDMRRRFGAR